uniref:C2H2-type domain-containing protein n=1 Tax=Panagrolaimus sp. JU765 TaxID=591449 RepID=A0AC34R8H1_9BILA
MATARWTHNEMMSRVEKYSFHDFTFWHRFSILYVSEYRDMTRRRTRSKAQVLHEEQIHHDDQLIAEDPEMHVEGHPYEQMDEQHIQMTEEHIDVDGEEAPIAVDDDQPPLLMPQKEPPIDDEEYVAVEEPEASYIEVAEGDAYEEGYYLEDGTTIKTDYDEVGADQTVCCGMCGEVMSYDILMNHHIPTAHPEIMAEGAPDFEEVSYDAWLRDRGTGYDEHGNYISMPRQTRPLRRVSQIRVKTSVMSLEELESSLKKKMVEKLGRAVPVTLVDKQHARCGYCHAVVSLNKKFEIVHLVRHFNAWHPSAHKCAGLWGTVDFPNGPSFAKPLSANDFAVIDTLLGAHDNLQCIWCGMFMDGAAVGMHFHEVHPDEIEVPKCNLCLQEVLINARLTERYGDNFQVVMPDERHYQCNKYNTKHSSEAALEKSIIKHLQREQNDGEPLPDDDEEEEEEVEEYSTVNAYSNSRMAFGRRSKPKRHFVMPKLRQAVPDNSEFIEPVDECHWRCKLCQKDILAAVISAGTIRHYREAHPERLSDCQMELCKTRLYRLSNACMEFLGPSEIECLICHMTYPLHKPFNMCRAVRHLKAKHPQQMPEYEGAPMKTDQPPSKKRRTAKRPPDLSNRYMIKDEVILSSLREKFNAPFTKVLNLKSEEGHPIYLLVNGPCHIDQSAIEQVLQQVEASNPVFEEGEPYVVQYSQVEDDVPTSEELDDTQIKHEVPDAEEVPMPETANNAEVFAHVNDKNGTEINEEAPVESDVANSPPENQENK